MAGRSYTFVRNSRDSLMFFIHSTINQPPFSLFPPNQITPSRDKGPDENKVLTNKLMPRPPTSVPINGPRTWPIVKNSINATKDYE